ncbi:PREDICTED: UPF0481 protein At3g47200 [Tarenaya hassleriana]|uniref:UPF0481 protein At3g47200 n=1 Tax=Tarenaya hassleriana TaxID=28532 RepID=UPI00053C7377|nr:PREDICTED: UPF0481 protein At3g47200 [Tarenaya hassleriana]
MDPQSQTNIRRRTQLLSERVTPKLLRKSAASKSCCIFRVPQSYTQLNPKAYEPKVVSIGPYHRGKGHLQMIQEHKHRFLEVFASTAQESWGVTLQDLIDSVSDLEEDIRDSYSEDLSGFNRENLIDLMVLDGCFILTLFLVVARILDKLEFDDDPIFKTPWIRVSIQNDLLLVENQIPFFVLQTLSATSKLVTSEGLTEIAFVFFKYAIYELLEFWPNHQTLKPKHLLDLIRLSFIPIPTQAPTSRRTRPIIASVLSAKQLQRPGMDIKRRLNPNGLLDIRLEDGVLQIPRIAANDFFISILLNFVVFEQVYAHTSEHITSYVIFLRSLIIEEDDETLLKQRFILSNYLITGDGISRFMKSISQDIRLNIEECYLFTVFEEVTKYTFFQRRAKWAKFKHDYLQGPWFSLSVILLVLTTVQTVFTVLAFFIDGKKANKGQV